MTDLQTKTDRAARIAALGYDYAAQPKWRRTGCNLCGGARFVTLAHVDRYGYPAKAQGCLACGLVTLNPVMTAEAYTRFYVDVYRPLVSAYHGRLIDAETIQDEQRDYAAALAEVLARHNREWQHVRPHTDGQRLKELGLAEGPRYAEILDKLRDAWLDGEIGSAEAEEAMLRGLLDG